MNIKSYERIAGLFVIGAIVAIFVFAISLGFEQGWFAKKVYFYTSTQQVEGIFPGTRVQVGGLRVGRVSDVKLLQNGMFEIHFAIFKKYASQFRSDTSVGFIRPYIIGERVLDVVPSETGELLADGSEVIFVENFDILETLNGRRIGPYMESMQALFENLRFLAEAFTDRKRSEDMVEIFDNLKPLIKNANRATKNLSEMANQMIYKKHLKTSLANIAALSAAVDDLVAFSKNLPELGEDTKVVMKNMSVLSHHLNDLVPTIQAIAPELPSASKKALQALEEALVVLQAMQKSFLLRGSVADVKEEQEKLKEEERKISSEKESDD